MQEKEKDKKRKQSDKKMCSFGSITAGKMYSLSECGACGDCVPLEQPKTRYYGKTQRGYG